jgi:Ca2+-binding RTX toxin-like protein
LHRRGESEEKEIVVVQGMRRLRGSLALTGAVMLVVAALAADAGAARRGPSSANGGGRKAAAALVPTSTSEFTINFERDATGAKVNGFRSVDDPGVAFSDDNGANLSLQDFGVQSIVKALQVGGDDASAMVLDFDVPMTAVSLVFGNDDDGFSAVGDQAVISMSRGAITVATRRVTMNRNDLADQVIAYAGRPFTRVTFVYATPAGVPINLIEIADEIGLTPRCSFRGTNRGETITANNNPNGICGLGGNDRIRAQGGNDHISGGPGKDKIFPSGGDDTVAGGAGNDVIRANDGAGTDAIYGGPGRDVCFIDDADVVSGCEDVRFA